MPNARARKTRARKAKEDKAKARQNLSLEIMIGDLSKVKNLCEAGVDFNNLGYCTDPIQEAVYYGHLEIIKYLVSIGNIIQSDKDNALITASEKGYFEIVEYLVFLGANVRRQKNQALIMASQYGHLKVVKYLVSQGADIHGTFKDELDFSLSIDIVIYLTGNSPIQSASIHGHLDVVLYLSNLGADISNICPAHKRYIAFCRKMEEKRRHRAAKKIYYWWIQICYDITRECGQRTKLKNLETVKELGLEFSD
jgi:hypothetical protein